ncbi:ISAs1 family transposase, partial [Halomonas llamarensis]
AALHVVSAWANEQQLALGQVATTEKSNEITAIPELLRLLEIRSAIVTLDAMGCQTAIAEQVVSQGADYILAVKDNQPTLYEALR